MDTYSISTHSRSRHTRSCTECLVFLSIQMTECDSSLVRSSLYANWHQKLQPFGQTLVSLKFNRREKILILHCHVSSIIFKSEEWDGIVFQKVPLPVSSWAAEIELFGWTLGCKTPSNAGWFSPDAVTQNTNNPPNCGAWKANQTIDLDDLDH